MACVKTCFSNCHRLQDPSLHLTESWK